jgi:hypothetical protein
VAVEYLERHLTVVLEIAREVHDRHAPMTDLPLDGITILQNCCEVFLELRQTAFRQGCRLQYHRFYSPAREQG